MSNNPFLAATEIPDVAPDIDVGENPFLKVDENEELANGAILTEAVDHSPDQAAEAYTFGARTGLPFDFVNENLEDIKKRDNYDNISNTLKDSPATKAFMTAPENARVSHDDLDNLTFFEKHVFAPLLPVVETVEDAFERGQLTNRRGYAGVELQATESIEALKQVNQLDSRIAELGPEPESGFLSFISSATEVLAQQYESYKRPDAAIYFGSGMGIGASVGAAGGPLAPATAAAGTIIGGTAAGISYAFHSSSIVEGGNDYIDMRQRGIDAQTASDHATWSGILKGALEIAPVAIIAAPFKNVLKKTIMSSAEKALLRPTVKRAALTFGKSYTAAILAESSTEVLQEIVGIVSEETAAASVGLDAIDLFDPSEAEKEKIIDNLATIFVKTAKAMALLGPLGPGLNFRSDFILAKTAKKNEQMIEAMGESAKASKVRERLPEKYKEFVEKVREQGPVKDIQIPADKFAEYFQSQGIDPMQAAKEISADIEQQLPEATGIGGDIIIPLQDYQTHVAGTEHHAGLSQDIRLQSGDMTMREAEAFETQMDEADQQLFEEFGEQAEVDATEASAFETVKTKIKQQLQDAGQTENVAEQQATLSASRAVTRAKRLGRDPLELAEERPVQIRSEVLERLREKPVDEFDLLIDRARSGRVVPEAEVRGQTLFDFLREKGGLQDVGGELAAREIPTKPGQRKLIQEAGLSFDDAAQMSQEAGFFPEGERTTINELLDAIDRESRGEPVFVEGREDIEEIQAQENVEELNRLLGEAGIDLQTATNEEIRAALGAELEARPVVSGRDGRAIIDQELFQAPTEKDLQKVKQSDIVNIEKDIERLKEGKYVPEQVPTEATEGIESSGVGPALELLRGFHETRNEVIPDRGVRNTPTEAEQTQRKKIKKAEAVALKEWAKENNLWRDSSAFYSQWEKQGKLGGSEHLVIISPDGKTVRKMASARMNTTLHEYLTRLAIHNFYFPEAQYKFIGMSETKKGTPAIVVEQRGVDMSDGSLITPNFKTEGQSPSELRAKAHEEMSARGFEEEIFDEYKDRVEGGARTFHYFINDEGLVIYDLSPGNVIHRPDGTMDFIDPVITFDPSTQLDRLQKQLNESKKLAEREDIGFEEDLGGIEGVELFQAPTQTLEDIARADESGILLDVSMTDDIITVSRIVVPEESRKQGLGTAKIEELIKHADETGAFIALTPTTDFGATSISRLKKFYKRLGFVENKGKNIIFSISEDMYRSPAGKEISLFQQRQRQDLTRGSIQFTDTETIINLFKNADLSTYLHESGHQYINELAQDAALADAPQQIKDDFQTLLDFVGAKTAEDLDISLHGDAAIEKQETLARAFETYLREGKAPSVELQTAFQNFKAWLISIYRTIKNLNVEVSEELTEVFDRMIATDEQIDIAERQAKYQPVFTTAEEGGMTAAEFNKHNEASQEVTAFAKEDLLKEALKEVTRERRKWWKEERSKMRTEVEAEINEMPVYQSIHFLSTGEFLVGEIPEGLDTVRLSKQMLTSQYGKEILKRLPKGKKAVYTAEDGVHPRVIADLFGFSSGDELIQAMLKAQPRVKAIENETDVRMKQKHGDMLNDGTIEEEAVDSIHNDKRANFIRTELRALSKKTGVPVLPKKVIKDAAKRIISEKRVRDINLGQYKRSEVKAADAAIRAVADGDFALATEETRKRLLNIELFIEANKAKIEIERDVRYHNKFKKPGTRANIETDYLDQIDALHERYDFKKSTTLREIERRKALNKWITEQEEDGNHVVIDEKLRNESVKRSYKDLPVEELRGFTDAIKNIEHLGRMKEKLLVAMEKRNLREVADEVADSILSNNKVHEVKPDFAPGILKHFTKGVDRFHAAHLKMEFIFEKLDGFKKLGPAWEALFAPIAEAETFEQKKMEGIIKELNKSFDAYTRIERAGWSLQKTFVEEVGQSFNKQAILSLALNWGNEGNREAIKDGYGWTDDQVNAILANMDKRDWETVQGIWELIESLWPEISELQKDLTGVAPEKVEHSSFSNEHGDWAGGYYPLKYDPEQSHTAYKRDEKIKSEDLFESNWLRPHTKNGHTIERVGSAGQKVQLDLSVITEHITNVVHDLAYRRAIIDVDRLSQQPQIKDAIESTAGKEVYRLVRPWLQSIANDFREPAGALEGWLGRARVGATVVNMGYKVTTAIVQPLGYLQSIDLIGEKWAAKGLGTFMRHPKRTLDFALERSVMMQNRQKTFDRDVRDALKKTTLRGPLFEVQQSFFYFTGLMDMTVAVPTWMGAYKKGLHEFDNDERRAIQAADQAVRMSQSAGGAKDLAQIQRGSEYHRVFTMFYSYFNVLYNLFNRRVGAEKKAGFSRRSIPKLAASMMYLWFAPAIMSELIAQRGPDDEDEYAEWVTKNLASYPFQTVVGVRDIANAMLTDYGYSMTPAADAFESIAKVGRIPSKLIADEDIEKADVKAALLAVGYWGQLPSRQMWITGEALYDWATGEDEPEGIVDGVRDLFFARRR